MITLMAPYKSILQFMNPMTALRPLLNNRRQSNGYSPKAQMSTCTGIHALPSAASPFLLRIPVLNGELLMSAATSIVVSL